MNIEIEKTNLLYMFMILALESVYFLPGMHERYAYIMEIVAIPLAFYDKKTIPMAIALELLTISTYSHYLFKTESLSCGSYYLLFIILAYGYVFIKRNRNKGSVVNNN